MAKTSCCSSTVGAQTAKHLITSPLQSSLRISEGGIGVIMENQMEKTMENDMETGIIINESPSHYIMLPYWGCSLFEAGEVHC